MTPLRVVDFSTEEVVEIPVVFLREHLYSYIEALKIARDERLDAVKLLVSDLDDAIALFAGYVARMEPNSKTVLFHDAMDNIAKLSQRLAKLYSFSTSAALLADNTVVKVSLAQVKEFGL